ncbi:hypothetical protein ACNQFN_21155 [Thauera butanivorans]|uniref:hypothetical protein n=1 Tax=Thauera butanivorans TaxID=86174 RepID=UPI003AB5FBA7
MLTWSERARHAGMEQGIQQGLLQGREEGREDGERELLSRRFGPLDRQTSERLQRAARVELERWADNMLEARRLQDVFDEH